MLVASPKVATYDLQPEMSAPEVTEKLVAAINEGRADFYIVNFANCDMVGHTGVFDAAVKAVEAVDDALSKVVPAILAKGGFALITADHGNADHMFDVASDGSKHPFTAHTTNRVPFIIVDEKAKLTGIEDGRLSDIAPTMLTMAGIEPSAEMTVACSPPRPKRKQIPFSSKGVVHNRTTPFWYFCHFHPVLEWQVGESGGLWYSTGV